MEVKRVESSEEIRKIIPLFVNVFKEDPYNEDWNEDKVFDRLNYFYNDGKGYISYIESEGGILGFICCSLQIWDDGNHFVIEDTCVDKKNREKGIGTLLVRDLEKYSKEKGISAIDLHVHKLSSAKDFWNKLGYLEDSYVQYSKNLS